MGIKLYNNNTLFLFGDFDIILHYFLICITLLYTKYHGRKFFFQI